MRVFVTGATGVLGHRLVERLVDRGHEVVGLVHDDGADLVADRGGIPRRGDVLDQASLAAVIDDVDAIVHAATSLPVTNPTEGDWARNDRIRLEGARNLVAVAGDMIERFLFPSVVWVARQPDGSAFDEDADRHPDRTTQSAADVEDFLEATAGDYGFDATVLCCGFLYASDAAHTREFGRRLLTGKFPILGGGVLGRQDARLSFLHADDAALAFADAVDAGASGRYHVVDEEPTAMAEFIRTFADRLEAPTPRRIPGWLARPFIGGESVELLTTPMPTANDRFRRAVDWELTSPTYREGLTRVVETWRNDGTLAETAEGYVWAGD